MPPPFQTRSHYALPYEAVFLTSSVNLFGLSLLIPFFLRSLPFLISFILDPPSLFNVCHQLPKHFVKFPSASLKPTF